MAERSSDHAERVQRAVLAAQGWLALDAAGEALEELAALDESSQEHPSVMHQRARALVAIGYLSQARVVVSRLARIAPDHRLLLLDDPALDPIWR